MKAKLMSYNSRDFQSKFHMEAKIKEMESVSETLGPKFKKLVCYRSQQLKF